MMTGNKERSITVFNFTEIGFSHIKSGAKCQDYSISTSITDNPKNKESQYHLAIVADGHGSADHFRSDIGSKLACEAACEAAKGFMSEEDGINNSQGITVIKKNHKELISQLTGSIITLWRTKIVEHYNSNPFSQDELSLMSDRSIKRYESNNEKYFAKAYGTTLIMAIKHRKFWIGLQIGDGKCVIIRKGKPEMPIPWDDRCFLNITTSLSDEDALQSFRHCYLENNPEAIFIASDGVDDSYIYDEKLFSFYKHLTDSFNKKGVEHTKKELKEFLPNLSREGSGDDISIAGIVSIVDNRDISI